MNLGSADRPDTRPVQGSDPGGNRIVSRGQGPAKLWTSYYQTFTESCHDVVMVPGGNAPDQSSLSFLGSAHGSMHFRASEGNWEWKPGKASGQNSFNAFLDARTYNFDDIFFEEKPVTKTSHLLQLNCGNKVTQGSEGYPSDLRFCHPLVANLLVEIPNIFFSREKRVFRPYLPDLILKFDCTMIVPRYQDTFPIPSSGSDD